MNTLIKTLCLLLISHSITCAVQATTSYGFQESYAQIYDNIEHAGALTLDKTTVKENLIVNGFLSAKNGTLNQLTINGDADLDNTKIQGVTTINGKLSVEDSHFFKPVTVRGQINAEDTVFEQIVTLHGTHSEFENCKLHSLMLEKSNDAKPLHVYLEETTIDGDVTFLSPGVIHVDKDSRIHGKITGAVIDSKG